MKESKIEWIGKIPKHWEARKLKYVSHHVSIKGLPQKGDIKISPENVESQTGKILNYHSDHGIKGLVFEEGDILFNKLGVHLNKVVFCDFTGFSMGEMIVIHSDSIDGRYLYRVLSSNGFIAEADSFSMGVKLPRSPVPDIMSIVIPIPSKQEQKLISKYLDKKTEIIDFLIGKTQKKIELLKELRSSLIQQYVTKGLAPDVKMKESKIEWIGKIPKHWEARKLKYVSHHVSIKGLPQDGDIKVSPENVESQTGKILSYHSDHGIKGLVFEEGDILLNKLGVYLNKVVFCDFTGFSMGEMIVIRPASIDGKYLYRVLSSNGFIAEADSFSMGVKLPRSPVSDIMSIVIPIPSKQEQKLISKCLDKKTKRIDLLASKMQKKVEILKEYREALISNVVTGKIHITEDTI